MVLYEERGVDLPQVVPVEVISKVPRPEIEHVPREVPRVHIQVQERMVEVPSTIVQERVVEIPQIQYVDCLREEVRPYTEYIDKQVPRVRTQTVERMVEVPQILHEERLFQVPQIQTVEAIREELVVTMQEVFKEIPKVHMEYREKVLEVSNHFAPEMTPKIESWFRIACQGGIHVRTAPAKSAPTTGTILQWNEIFCASEEIPASDGYVYLRLRDRDGWVFDDSAMMPDDPSVRRLSSHERAHLEHLNVARPMLARTSPVGEQMLGRISTPQRSPRPSVSWKPGVVTGGYLTPRGSERYQAW